MNQIIMKKYIYTSIMAIALMAFAGCSDNIDPLTEELDVNRVLTPTKLSVVIRTLTTADLSWHVRNDADRYVVEFSEDSLQFTNIIRTVEVLPTELPVLEVFEGSTRYSARVKGISASGKSDSNWGMITFVTGDENIFLDIQAGDVSFTEATLRWPAGSEVTHITLNPGNIQHTITTDEKAAGVALVTGLNANTQYTARLYNNTKPKGLKVFTTLNADGTVIGPATDLVEAIEEANSGDVLLLLPGDYTVNAGATIALTKSITIKGMYPYDRPKLRVSFNLQSGATNVELADLDLNGTEGTTLDRLFNLGTAGVTYGSVKISGCNIHDFGPQLIYGNVAASLDLFSVDNSIITNFSGGGDFIDFRPGYVKEVKLTNSTFNNCAPARDFVRLDNSSASFPSSTSSVLIDHCTFYGVSAGASNRILYVRFVSNESTVQNSLFAAANGNYSNQAATSQPTCANNNYFNAPGYYTVSGSNKLDISGTYTTLDPGFTDAANGNFTIGNQALIDNQVGDPRWRP